MAASSNAAASSAGVSELLPSTARAKPRKIWDRITPELPRAPMRLPCEASLAILLTSAAFDSFTSSTADCRVSSMFVPVSPSGTGKTLSRFTSSWLVPSQLRLPSSARLNSGPSTPIAFVAAKAQVLSSRTPWTLTLTLTTGTLTDRSTSNFTVSWRLCATSEMRMPYWTMT